MATAKKRASAKKTTKAKSASAKTAAKRAASKVIEQPVKQPRTLSRFELLRRFHLFSAAFAVVIAVAAVLFLNDSTVNFTSVYSVRDPIASGSTTVLGTANESLVTVQIRYLVAAVFVISAVFSLLLATKLRARYEAGINNATSGIRWIFAGVVIALIVEIVTLLTGVEDIATLKLVAGLILVTTTLGWLAERNQKDGASKWGAYILSLFTGAMAWLPAVFAAVGTYLYGIERYGWHVYALVLLVVFGGIRFAQAQYHFIKYPALHKDYLVDEEKYLSNELLIKLAFAAVTFIALIG